MRRGTAVLSTRLDWITGLFVHSQARDRGVFSLDLVDHVFQVQKSSLFLSEPAMHLPIHRWNKHPLPTTTHLRLLRKLQPKNKGRKWEGMDEESLLYQGWTGSLCKTLACQFSTPPNSFCLHCYAGTKILISWRNCQTLVLWDNWCISSAHQIERMTWQRSAIRQSQPRILS